MQLGLGTANFAMQYGVTNTSQLSPLEIKQILDEALSSGLRYIDTAQLYGDAESVLGQYQNLNQFDVVSKVGEITDLSNEQVLSSVQGSLKRLGIDQLYGLLMHRAEELLGENGQHNYDKVFSVKASGLAKKIGVSVYRPEELEKVISKFNVDLVQIPINVFDQRFLQSGVLHKAKQKNIEIHARSVYLQGTLLSDVAELPPYFRHYQSNFEQFDHVLQQYQLSKPEAALSFVKSLGAIDVTIVGCNSLEQLLQTTNMCRQLPPEIVEHLRSLASTDEGLILPTNWRSN